MKEIRQQRRLFISHTEYHFILPTNGLHLQSNLALCSLPLVTTTRLYDFFFLYLRSYNVRKKKKKKRREEKRLERRHFEQSPQIHKTNWQRSIFENAYTFLHKNVSLQYLKNYTFGLFLPDLKFSAQCTQFHSAPIFPRAWN